MPCCRSVKLWAFTLRPHPWRGWWKTCHGQLFVRPLPYQLLSGLTWYTFRPLGCATKHTMDPAWSSASRALPKILGPYSRWKLKHTHTCIHMRIQHADVGAGAHAPAIGRPQVGTARRRFGPGWACARLPQRQAPRSSACPTSPYRCVPLDVAVVKLCVYACRRLCQRRQGLCMQGGTTTCQRQGPHMHSRCPHLAKTSAGTGLYARSGGEACKRGHSSSSSQLQQRQR